MVVFMPSSIKLTAFFFIVSACRGFNPCLERKWVSSSRTRGIKPRLRSGSVLLATDRPSEGDANDDLINSIEAYKEGLLPYTDADRAKFQAARDNAALAARARAISKAGGGKAGALVQLMTEAPVGDTLLAFFMNANPMVSGSMRETVSGLMGGLPRDVDVSYKTTSDKLGKLAGLMMMTGYLFRNAEYVVTLQQLLNIKSRSLEEYKRVFDEIDKDSSGFIEVEEVETLLSRFYGGETPPPFEVTAFVRFFDRKKRGKIGWTDFKDGFGLAQAASNGGESGNIDGAAATGAGAELKALMSGKGSLDTKRLFELAAGLDDDSSGSNGSTADSSRLLGSGDKPTTSPSRDDNVEDGKESAPDGTTAEESSQDESGGGAEGGAADVKLSVEGTISVELEGGAKVEVDAAQYLDGLKAEAEALRGALQQAAVLELNELGLDASRAASAGAAAVSGSSSSNSDSANAGSGEMRQWNGLAEYIASLGPKQKSMLTDSIEPTTVEAMRRLVNFMVGEMNPDKSSEVDLARGSLASLCLWQLVVGYQLRDAEATGKANEVRGR